VRLLLPEPSASPRPRLPTQDASVVLVVSAVVDTSAPRCPVVFGCLLTDFFCSADIGACPSCPSCPCRQCIYAASRRHLPSSEPKLSSTSWRLRGGFNLARLLIRGPSPVTSNVTPPHCPRIVFGGLYMAPSVSRQMAAKAPLPYALLNLALDRPHIHSMRCTLFMQLPHRLHGCNRSRLSPIQMKRDQIVSTLRSRIDGWTWVVSLKQAASSIA
jgi:hypothetical protein